MMIDWMRYCLDAIVWRVRFSKFVKLHKDQFAILFSNLVFVPTTQFNVLLLQYSPNSVVVISGARLNVVSLFTSSLNTTHGTRHKLNKNHALITRFRLILMVAPLGDQTMERTPRGVKAPSRFMLRCQGLHPWRKNVAETMIWKNKIIFL